jgi:hypothetical protein
MCKILLQGHACGHDVTLRKESCFLVKNKFQCTDEEKKLVNRSKHSCTCCRRQQRKLLNQEAISSSVDRETRHNSSQAISKPQDTAKVLPQDPATIIANLKALCAQVVAEKQAAVAPNPKLTRSNSIGPEYPRTEASVSNECAIRNVRGITAAAQVPDRVCKGSLAAENAFFDFMDEMDDIARKSHTITKSVDQSIGRCQSDDRPSEDKRQPWTRDSLNLAASLGRNQQMRYYADLGLQLSARSTGYLNSPLSGKPRTKTDNEAEAIRAKPRAGKPSPVVRRRRHSSNMSTASARSAKRKINEMLHREFEQTAHLGDIVLDSRENSPLAVEAGGDYDPAQSNLAFVKHSRYGQ